MRLSKEQYNTLLQKGLTGGEIEQMATARGYKLPDNRDVLQKTTDVVNTIFPGKQVGQAIGTLAGYALTPKENKQYYDLSAPTPLQVAGDIGSGAAMVAGLKGVGTVGKLGTRVLQSSALGAGMAGSQAIAEKKPIGKVLGSATGGAVLGGGLSFAGAGIEAIAKGVKGLPARFVNSAVGRSKQQVLKDISKDKVDDFSKWVLANKKVGTADTLWKESSDNLDILNNKLDTALKSAVRKTGGKITIGVNNFLDDIVKLPEAEGAMLKRADIKGIITKLAPQTKQLLNKPSLTVAEANKLRQLVDKTLGDRAFLGGQLSSDKIILKTFGDNLRELVKTKAPAGTRELFSEYANEINFNKGLLSKIAQKQGNQVLSFGDFIGGGLGGIFGGGVGGAIAGVAARRAIESVPFKMGAAITAQKLTNVLTKAKPVIDQLTPVQRTAIMEMFANLLAPEESATEQPNP